jgi:prepilin-type N-terminal cleavage/methylation domain-containing protein
MLNYRHTRAKGKRGFTLVEVMIAALVAAVALLALLGTAFMAYKINQKARLRDNARSVLRTYVDQFQRLGYATDSSVTRMLFTPTGSTEYTGLGLRWGQLSDEANYVGAPTTLNVDIGSPGSPVIATVTRNVSFVTSSTGNGGSSPSNDGIGILLRADFRITYSLAGANQNSITQSISTLRFVKGN